MYNTKIKFNLPGVFVYKEIYNILTDLYINKRYMFDDNIEIGAIYGCPSGSLWNGGVKVSNKNALSQDELLNIKNKFLSYNIPVRLTFTNSFINEEHLFDFYSNILLEIFNTGTNEIVVNSKILKEYIQNNYKNKYKLISSTTKCLNEEETLEELNNKDYFLVCLNQNLISNIDFIKSLPKKEKIEILVNRICDQCEKRKEHYDYISKLNLFFLEGEDDFCNKKENKPLLGLDMKRKTFLTKENINNIYIPLGITNFKIEGRNTVPLDLIELLIYYLIKEEYQYEVRSLLQSTGIFINKINAGYE